MESEIVRLERQEMIDVLGDLKSVLRRLDALGLSVAGALVEQAIEAIASKAGLNGQQLPQDNAPEGTLTDPDSSARQMNKLSLLRLIQ